MPQLKDDIYTIEDIYALPDAQHARLIDFHRYTTQKAERYSITNTVLLFSCTNNIIILFNRFKLPCFLSLYKNYADNISFAQIPIYSLTLPPHGFP